MSADEPDHDLRAQLEAERASTDHWRRVARRRTAAHDEIKHRPSVRAVLGMERRLSPLGRTARGWARDVRRTAERAALAASSLTGRRHRSGVAQAGPPAPTRGGEALSRVTLIVIGERSTPARDLPPVGEVRHLVGADSRSASPGRAVHQAVAAARGDLVCVLAATSEPASEAWLATLVAAVDEGVAAATAVLVHPERPWRQATPHDGAVRAAGIDVTIEDGVPVAKAIGAGGAALLSKPPSEVAAAGAACLVLDRASVADVGGFPPSDDLDVAAIELCARLRHAGGRVLVVPAVVVVDHRPVRSFRELRRPIAPGDPAWRRAVDRSGPILLRRAGDRPPGLRIALTAACPSRKVAERWGDWHLANGLAASLATAGHETLVFTADEADGPRARTCDLHVVLRGLTPVRRTSGQRHVLWVISHPESIEDQELHDADLVLVASTSFATELRTRTSTPVEVMLQATDPRRFRPVPAVPRHRHAVTVVARTRDVPRRIVIDAVEAGMRPAIYGSGWEGLVDPSLIVATHVDHAELPEVYSSAGVVLNDHWDTMRSWGFVSNRIFDVLACGTPIVSDPVAEIDQLFDSSVATYRSSDELGHLVDAILGDPAAARARARAGMARVLASHTFDHRAQELLASVEQLA